MLSNKPCVKSVDRDPVNGRSLHLRGIVVAVPKNSLSRTAFFDAMGGRLVDVLEAVFLVEFDVIS